MIQEKLLVTLLVGGWRVIHALGLFALGRLDTEEGSVDRGAAGRESSWWGGMIWTTVLVLIVLGIPLARNDSSFVTAAHGDFQAVTRLAQTVLVSSK